MTKERKAYAKALSQYGFALDACIEALAECNNDMNAAAIALVRRYGPPVKVVQQSTPPSTATSKSNFFSSLFLYSFHVE